MSQQLPVEMGKSLVQAYSEKDWEALWSLVDSRIIYDEVPTRRKTHGRQRFMTILQEWAAAFPDFNITIENSKVFGNTVSFDLRWMGTHDGPIETPGGTIFPTGKKIDLAVSMVVEVGENQVETVTHLFDMAEMEKQIELTQEERSA